MKKYFEVIAKAGHVGKNNYTEISLYIIAESRKAAAEKARWIPRVKHHDKYAIIDVLEITYGEFNNGILTNSVNPYFKVRNIQEQRAICNDIEIKRYELLKNHKKNNEIEDFEKKTLKERNPRKYQKYCGFYDSKYYIREYCIA